MVWKHDARTHELFSSADLLQEVQNKSYCMYYNVIHLQFKGILLLSWAPVTIKQISLWFIYMIFKKIPQVPF